jgi:hypothetical protein
VEQPLGLCTDADKPALRFVLAASWANDIKGHKNYTDSNEP